MAKVIDLDVWRGAHISPPAPISDLHKLDQFDCGKPPLNDWLRGRALKADGRSARTFVVTENSSVIAYYALATGGVKHEQTPGSIRRNMPDPVPVMILARLAIDKAFQGKGLGSALFANAARRVVSTYTEVGFAALLVHAIDDEARGFYLQYGMREFPVGTGTLFLPVETLISTFSE